MTDQTSSLKVSFDDQVSAGTNAAAEALNKLADAAGKAGTSTDGAGKGVGGVGETIKRTLPSITSVNNALDTQAKLAAQTARANQLLTDQLAVLNKQLEQGKISQQDYNDLEKLANANRDLAVKKATDQAAAMKKAQDVMLGSRHERLR